MAQRSRYDLRMTNFETKITFGEMRASGVRDVLIYCRDHRCSHHVEANADGWVDDVRLSDIEPNFTRTALRQERALRCGPHLGQPRWGRASKRKRPATGRAVIKFGNCNAVIQPFGKSTDQFTFEHLPD